MNVLIFGYGYMGKIRHEVLRGHPEVRQVWVYDPGIDPAREDLRGIRISRREEIPWGDLDGVFICTPNNVTADWCVEALRRGRPVFCEKPPGKSWEDFCRIEEAAGLNPGSILVFGFNHRLHPSIQAAQSMIGQGGLGRVLYLKGTYGKSGGARYRESWRNNPEISGGGILLDQGIHLLDLFHLFLGKLSVVDAVLADSFWKTGLEDNAFVLMKSEEGVPAFLHSSATLWKHTFWVEVGCSEGYLAASGFLSKTGSYGREQLVIGRRQFEDEAFALGNPREEIIHFDRDESWEKEVGEFLAAIRENRPATHGTLEEARRVMQLIQEVYSMAELYKGARPIGTQELI